MNAKSWVSHNVKEASSSSGCAWLRQNNLSKTLSGKYFIRTIYKRLKIFFLNLAFTKMEFCLKVTCSGSIGFPFILLASARTFLASSMRPLIGGEIQLGRPSACHDFLASIILLCNHHHHRHHLTLQSTISGTPGARREELHPQPPWRR